MIVPHEVCEVAPVVRVYVLHVPLEVLPAHLHLPLQARLVAELPSPRCGGLHAERVGSWGDTKTETKSTALMGHAACLVCITLEAGGWNEAWLRKKKIEAFMVSVICSRALSMSCNVIF